MTKQEEFLWLVQNYIAAALGAAGNIKIMNLFAVKFPNPIVLLVHIMTSNKHILENISGTGAATIFVNCLHAYIQNKVSYKPEWIDLS